MKKYLKIISSTIVGIMVVSSGTVFANAKTITVDSENACNVCGLSECVGNLLNCNNAKVLINSAGCDILKECDVQSVLNNFDCADIIAFQSGNCTVTEPTDTVEPTESTTVAVTVPEVTDPVVEVPTTEPVESTQPSDSYEYNKAYADEVIRLVNIEREKYGLSALEKNTGATKAAETRSKEITQSFSHTRPDGTSFSTIANELNISYRTIGENIAYGYPSPESVVEGWMNSQGHRENILSSSFNGIGVGCYENNGVLYWAQIFIGA